MCKMRFFLYNDRDGIFYFVFLCLLSDKHLKNSTHARKKKTGIMLIHISWCIHRLFNEMFCSKLQFAMNIGVKFYTPEEFFMFQKTAPFSLPEFDPVSITWCS